MIPRRTIVATALLCCLPPVAADEKPVNWGALFQLHWKNRVAQFEQENRAWQNVVLLGDSITEGFDAEKYFPGCRILNRGIGADVIGNEMAEGDPRGVLQRLENSVFECGATDVFILIGINDLNSGRSVEQMERGYRELLTRIRAHNPKLRIHVQSILPTGGDREDMNPTIVRFNETLRNMADEFGCGYIDLHSLMKDESGNLKATFTNDGLHLTHEAYLAWRQEILKTLKWTVSE